MSGLETQGKPRSQSDWFDQYARHYGYHSVAGQPAAVLQGANVAPLTLLDFIDDRVRAIDAERLRLGMMRERFGGLEGVTIDDLRRLLG